ncbi:DUF5326 family protein [Streptomyces sp. KLOTTS4A1]|uniref:DUF5326 family protein n=1 Tax=Streptomyces sp. KLOTTS4A1 TaxID=3390996 RepID=UPI0039F4C7E0
MNEILAGMPWWVKWIAIPVIALVIFGSVLWTLVTFVVGLLFKVLVFAALVGGLVYFVRKYKDGSSSSNSGW